MNHFELILFTGSLIASFNQLRLGVLVKGLRSYPMNLNRVIPAKGNRANGFH